MRRAGRELHATPQRFKAQEELGILELRLVDVFECQREILSGTKAGKIEGVPRRDSRWGNDVHATEAGVGGYEDHGRMALPLPVPGAAVRRIDSSRERGRVGTDNDSQAARRGGKIEIAAPDLLATNGDGLHVGPDAPQDTSAM